MTGRKTVDARLPARPIEVFALTAGGARTAACVASILDAELRLPAGLTGASTPAVPERSFAKAGPALQEAFKAGHALVCVMASGIVIRSLAPVLMDKTTDPPVLVLDEAGGYVIPLLSGHLGGANALAGHLARSLGARAVLTTSSDVQGFVGPDLLAVALEGQLLNAAALLPVAAALANGTGVDLWYSPTELGQGSDFLENLPGYVPRVAGRDGRPPATGELPAVVVALRGWDCAGAVLGIVPRVVVAGVGCKRGTGAERLIAAVHQAFEEAGLHRSSLRAVASIRAKADEQGLLDAAEQLDVPAWFASAEAIDLEIERYGLTETAFVRQAVGAGAVSEPAALWGAGEKSRLLLPKRASRGVTVALALTDAGQVVEKTRERWWR
jgi:cobalt-precorrin 5A hydrolase